MKNLLSTISPPAFSLSAIAIGYVLSNDLDPSEQNTVGNWFMLIGQVLCTNAAQQQVINNSNNNQNGEHIVNDFDMNTLKRSIRQMNDEINKF